MPDKSLTVVQGKWSGIAEWTCSDSAGRITKHSNPGASMEEPNTEGIKPRLCEVVKQIDAAASALSKAFAGRLDGKFNDNSQSGSWHPDANSRIAGAIKKLMNAAREIQPLTDDSARF